jgi:cytochrome c553
MIGGLWQAWTLASVLAFALTLVGFYKVNFPPVRGTPSDIKIAATPEQLARGAKIAQICAGCHSATEDPPLTGQNMFANGGGPPVGTMYAPNLTPAGEIKDWTDGEIIRAIREGIHKSGRSLIVMPAEIFATSDADVQSVVAFLRSQPATGAQSPPTKLNVVGALLIALVS